MKKRINVRPLNQKSKTKLSLLDLTVTKKEKEFANDEEILALKKQLDEIKKLKAKDEKEGCEKEKR